MNDYQAHLLESATFLRSVMGNRETTITIYKSRETLRRVRINDDNTVETLVGQTWRHSYVDPCGLRKVMVK